MNSCRGKREIMSFHEPFVLMERTYLAWCQSRMKLRGRCNIHKGFDEDVKGIMGENVMDKSVNKVFDVMLVYVCVFLFCSCFA